MSAIAFQKNYDSFKTFKESVTLRQHNFEKARIFSKKHAVANFSMLSDNVQIGSGYLLNSASNICQHTIASELILITTRYEPATVFTL